MTEKPYPDYLFEEAAKREAEKPIIAKLSEEDYQKVMECAKEFMEEYKEDLQHLAAFERQELAQNSFDELTKDQKIQLALEELDWIVIGGQDGEEFYNSIQFIRKVLKSLKETTKNTI